VIGAAKKLAGKATLGKWISIVSHFIISDSGDDEEIGPNL
jgi:hypothetical protein